MVLPTAPAVRHDSLFLKPGAHPAVTPRATITLKARICNGGRSNPHSQSGTDPPSPSLHPPVPQDSRLAADGGPARLQCPHLPHHPPPGSPLSVETSDRKLQASPRFRPGTGGVPSTSSKCLRTSLVSVTVSVVRLPYSFLLQNKTGYDKTDLNRTFYLLLTVCDAGRLVQTQVVGNGARARTQSSAWRTLDAPSPPVPYWQGWMVFIHPTLPPGGGLGLTPNTPVSPLIDLD